MKSKEELNELKEEVEALNKKLKELSADELKLISGGGVCDIPFEWRLDGSLCNEDCLGRCDKDDCAYNYCKWDRWC